MDMNQQSMIGRVGSDPMISTSTSGTLIAKIGVATQPDQSKDTEWNNVICFGKTAELVEKFVTKGTQVYIHGDRIKSSYTDKEGEQKSAVQIITRKLVLLSKSNENSNKKYNNEPASDDVPF